MTAPSNKRYILIWSALVCLLVLGVMGFMYWQQTQLARTKQQQSLELQAESVAMRVEALVARASSVTRSLAFVVNQYGMPKSLDSLGSVLLREHPFLSAIQLFKNGTIVQVYPLQGNEQVIGYNVKADPSKKAELEASINAKDFYLAGPFELKQGGKGFVGRFPIFNSDQSLLGLAGAIIRWDDFMLYVFLNDSNNHAYGYVMRKTTPSGSIETIVETRKDSSTTMHAKRSLLDNQWELFVYPTEPINWSSQSFILIIGLILGLAAGFGTWSVLSQPVRLQKMVDSQVQTVKQLNEVYKETIERISDGFASIDKHGKVLLCNRKMARMFDLDPSHLLGKSLQDSITDFSKSALGVAIQSSLKSGKSQSLHIQRTSDLMWFEVNLYPGLHGMSVYSKEITKEEEALRLLELTNQVARIGGWEFLPSEDKLHLSPVAMDLLKLKSPQLATADFPEYFGEKAAELQEAIRKLAKGQGHIDLELAVTKGYTKPLWIKIIAETTQDGLSGKRILGTVQDIQSRMAYQEKMADTAQQYRNLFDLTPVPMWTFDAKTFKIIAANDAAAKEYGYNQTELVQRPISQMFSPGVFSQFLKQIGTQSSKALISEHRRKNGQLLYVEMYFTEIEHEKSKAYLLLARDITERLNNMRAIESQNQRLREIAWMQSHKVRAPLARILAIAQLVEPEYFDPAHDKHLIDEICKSAHELDQILMEIVQRTESNGKEKTS